MTGPTSDGAGRGWALPPVEPGATQVRAPMTRTWRPWLAILVTLLVIATGAGMAVVTTPASASSTIAYVSANAIIYVEGRTDLPGGQAVAVASLLSRSSRAQPDCGRAWWACWPSGTRGGRRMSSTR